MAKIEVLISLTQGFTGISNGKEFMCQFRRHRRCGFDPQFGKIPWRRAWQCFPVFFAWRIPWTDEPGGLLSVWSLGSGIWLKWCMHTSLGQFHNYNYTVSITLFSSPEQLALFLGWMFLNHCDINENSWCFELWPVSEIWEFLFIFPRSVYIKYFHYYILSEAKYGICALPLN